MTYTMRITKVATGDAVLFDHDGPFRHESWEDGNYSCDCNRHLFWLRARGLPEDDELCHTGVCIGDGRYTAEFMGGDVWEDA